MPYYDYHCPSCRERTTRLVRKISERHEQECACGDLLEQQVTSALVRKANTGGRDHVPYRVSYDE